MTVLGYAFPVIQRADNGIPGFIFDGIVVDGNNGIDSADIVGQYQLLPDKNKAIGKMALEKIIYKGTNFINAT